MAKEKKETATEEVAELEKLIEESKGLLENKVAPAPKEVVEEVEAPKTEEVVEEKVAEPVIEAPKEVVTEDVAPVEESPVTESVAEGHTQEFETPKEMIVNSRKDVPVLDVSVLLEKVAELYSLKEKDPEKLRDLYETCRFNCIRFGLPLRDLRDLFAEAGLELN